MIPIQNLYSCFTPTGNKMMGDHSGLTTHLQALGRHKASKKKIQPVNPQNTFSTYICVENLETFATEASL